MEPSLAGVAVVSAAAGALAGWTLRDATSECRHQKHHKTLLKSIKATEKRKQRAKAALDYITTYLLRHPDLVRLDIALVKATRDLDMARQQLEISKVMRATSRQVSPYYHVYLELEYGALLTRVAETTALRARYKKELHEKYGEQLLQMIKEDQLQYGPAYLDARKEHAALVQAQARAWPQSHKLPNSAFNSLQWVGFGARGAF